MHMVVIIIARKEKVIYILQKYIPLERYNRYKNVISWMEEQND